MKTMASIAADYMKEASRSLRAYKRLAEGALAQVHDDEFFRRLDPESNSVALIVKHITGNMRSRWTDFLASDGEKPDRHRDQEFEEGSGIARDDLMRAWDEAWQVMFASLDGLQPEDLERTITIRNDPYSVLKAINVAINHYAYHIGQIAFLAKHFRGTEWKSLSTPKPRQ